MARTQFPSRLRSPMGNPIPGMGYLGGHTLPKALLASSGPSRAERQFVVHGPVQSHQGLPHGGSHD